MPPRRQKPAPRRSDYDLHEVSPRYFIIHNPSLRGIIKSEGSIAGNRFHMTGWRREGMLARLRERGFRVLTMEEQIDALPALPAALPIDEEPCPRPLAANERYRFFDPRQGAWASLEPEAAPEGGEPVLLLRPGWMVQRRRGRGAPAYYRVVRERSGGAGLVALDETDALLMGWAQVAAVAPHTLPTEHDGEQYRLPAVPDLPPPYVAMLRRIAQHNTESGWQVDAHAWPLVGRLLARLGIALDAAAP
jgi:hypothetical protein